MKAEWSNREYVDGASQSPMGPKPGIKLDAGTHGSGTMLPWPSLGWQQAALAGAVLLGLMISAPGIVAIVEPGDLIGGLVATLVGFSLAGMAVYAGWTTRWLARTSMAPLPAKVGAVVAIGLVIGLAAAIYGLAVAIYCVLTLVSILGMGSGT